MKKNVASQVIGGQLISSTDGSDFTGAVTCYVTVDGGTQTQGTVGSGACTHEGNGYHTYTPSQAETNGALLAFTFKGTGAITATVQVYTDFPQTGDAYAQTNDGTTGLAAIKGYVDDIGVAGAGLTALPAVTLADGNHGGVNTVVTLKTPIASDIAKVGGQTASASAPVAFPANIGTSTYAGADTSGTTELLTRIPDATAGTNGGLPTVDANNYIAGIHSTGTKNTLDSLNDPSAATIATQVNTTLSTAHGSGTWGSAAGSGAITFTYTLTSSVTGLPIADADVWVTTDAAGVNILGSGKTTAAGVVTFYLDAGTVYVWRQKSGWNFTNPDTEVVA